MTSLHHAYRRNQLAPTVRDSSACLALHRGMTMVELTATMAANGIIIAGLVASIMMSQKSLQITAAQQQGVIHQRQSLDQLRSDLREATRLENTNANTLTLTVPDRTGDNVPDEVRYHFPTDNSATVNRVANSVTTPYQMGTVSRTDRANYFVPAAPLPTPATVLKVTGFTSALSNNTVTSLVVPSPPTTSKNDMLILVIAADSTSGTFTTTSTNWQSMLINSGNGLQLRIHARIVTENQTPSETVSCTNNIRMSAAIIQISGHNSIVIVNSQGNTSSSTSSPTVVGAPTTTNNSIVFRFLAARDKNFIPNFTGLRNHNNLIMRAGDNDSSAITLGIGYIKYPAITGQLSDRFYLTQNESYVGASIAVGALQN